MGEGMLCMVCMVFVGVCVFVFYGVGLMLREPRNEGKETTQPKRSERTRER